MTTMVPSSESTADTARIAIKKIRGEAGPLLLIADITNWALDW
ncbi:MAG: hypothetical protein OXN21_01295 [Chloroflexota bacterium]|nr:hypothetical protein [Chloroflexota bacterium]